MDRQLPVPPQDAPAAPEERLSLLGQMKRALVGPPRDLADKRLFHRLSIVAFLAWVGLGADGLSSACYGPAEAYQALRAHPHLALFVALAAAITVIVISASYSQIIELFPSGGGGYVVASKLLSPGLGMVAGCALLIDYVLTITLSIASGADALFSFLPPAWAPFRLSFAVGAVIVLSVVNLRGVKESVMPLIPIFLIFVGTHVFAVLYALATHVSEAPALAAGAAADVRNVTHGVGILALVILLLRSYSLGAGTYTGIEAISNGLPMLREPRVATGKRAMLYMALSLAFTASGLMVAYILFDVTAQPGKTLNAVLFENMTASWSHPSATVFVLVTLISESAILFVAAQTGFLGGPRILANMALDRWCPTRFAMLSDRLVTQDGILLMGAAALVLMVLTGGSVQYLVVLYSINVFITFFLSQLGMVRHWWGRRSRRDAWKRKLLICGTGLALTAAILFAMVVIKFHDGGWVTLLMTGALAALALIIRRHYAKTLQLLRRLDDLAQDVLASTTRSVAASATVPPGPVECRPDEKTAVVLVSGYNGLGVHTLAGVVRLFGTTFRNVVFLQVGVVDAGNFKGREEMSNLQAHVQEGLDRYVKVAQHWGFYAEGFSAVGTDPIDEILKLAPQVQERFPQAVFFGGQLVFKEDSFLTQTLHNNVVFALQRKFYHRGMPFIVLPIRV